MEKKTSPAVLAAIGKIYISLLKRTGALLGFLGAAVGIAALLVLPVWYLAENHRKLYTVIVLICIAGTVLFLTIRKIAGKRRMTGPAKGRHFLRFFWQFGAVLCFIAWIYFTVILIMRGTVFPAVVLIIGFIAAFGLFLYAKRKTDH